MCEKAWRSLFVVWYFLAMPVNETHLELGTRRDQIGSPSPPAQTVVITLGVNAVGPFPSAAFCERARQLVESQNAEPPVASVAWYSDKGAVTTLYLIHDAV